MNDLAILEEAPVIEKIHTRTDERRENRKSIAARLRKSPCAKRPYSRKQALTACSYHMSQGDAAFLRPYRCPKCPHWHMTHQADRRRPL
jgi:hypothetical protein